MGLGGQPSRCLPEVAVYQIRGAVFMREISPSHLRLGTELRRIRQAAGVSTRMMVKPDAPNSYFSSGHISLVENGRTVPSPELIDAYVRLADDSTLVRALHAQMLAAAASAGRQRRGGVTAPFSAQAPRDLSEVKSREDIQRHYVVERHEASYDFDGGGAIAQVDFAISLRATSPGVCLYLAGHSYPADPQPGVLRVTALGGGTLVRARESFTGAVQSYFALDRELNPSDAEPHLLRFRLTVRSAVRSAAHLRYHAERGNQSLLLRTRFAAPAVPARLWWVGVPNVVDSEYPEAHHELTLDAEHGASRQFSDLVAGWCYGFGWTWPGGKVSERPA